MIRKVILASALALAGGNAAYAQPSSEMVPEQSPPAAVTVPPSEVVPEQSPPAVVTLPPSQAQVYDDNSGFGLSNAGVPAGPYIKGGGGYSWGAESRWDNAWVYGGGVGFRFNPWFRMDATFDYRPDFHDADAGGAKFRNWSGMLNGYIDFNVPFLRPLIPYIGAGAGAAQNKLGGSTVTVSGTSVASITGSSKDQFAWQAMAGASYYITPTVALDVAYRYFHGGSAESGTGSGFPVHGDFDAHEVVGYVRFGF